MTYQKRVHKVSLWWVEPYVFEAKAVYRRIFENPCVGGSIPPRATKNLNSPLIGLFLFGLADEVPLARITSPLKLTNEIYQGYSL